MSNRWLSIRRQSLPAPTELPTASGGKFLYLSPVWFAFVQGFIAELESRNIWVGSEAEIDSAIASVLHIESTFTNEAEMILDVRVFEGKLQALVAGVWTDKGALIQTWEGGFDDIAGLIFTV